MPGRAVGFPPRAARVEIEIRYGRESRVVIRAAVLGIGEEGTYGCVVGIDMARSQADWQEDTDYVGGKWKRGREEEKKKEKKMS